MVKARTDDLHIRPSRSSSPDVRIAQQLPRDTHIAVPLDVIAPENYLNLLSIVRHPPELQLHQTGPSAPTSLHEANMATLKSLSQIATSDLAYRIVSLLVRREAEVAQCDCSFAQSGFTELELTARMMEHLMVKRTSGTE